MTAIGSVDSPALEAVRARLLDGTITVDASEGNGSSFVVTLPRR